MLYLIIGLEVLAVVSLLIFNGILESKYYEKMPIKAVSEGVTYACIGLTAVFIVRYMQLSGLTWFWLPIALLCAHLVLNIVMVVVLFVAWKKFSALPLKFAKQYLLARAALGFSVVFEVLTLLALFWHYIL